MSQYGIPSLPSNNGETSDDGGEGQVRLWSPLSQTHIAAAAEFARRCGELETYYVDTYFSALPDHQDRSADRSTMMGMVDHRSYALGSITMAASFLEALVNELFAAAADAPMFLDDPSPDGKGLSADHKTALAVLWSSDTFAKTISILPKYQLALLCTGRSVFDAGKQPYQDANVLMKLRNALVHYKPEWYQVKPTPGRTMPGSKTTGLEKDLRGRFQPSRLTRGGNPFFPDQCLGHGCTEWAVKSAIAFADEFSRRLGITPRYRARPAHLLTR